MSEGLSDWIGLMLMLKEEDYAEKPFGYGTYASSQPIDGLGIRNAPYTTDFSVNDYTYGDTNNTSDLSQPHGVGFRNNVMGFNGHLLINMDMILI